MSLKPEVVKTREDKEREALESTLYALAGINTAAIVELLNRVQAEKQTDPTAGIFISELTHMPAIRVGYQDYYFHAARVLAKNLEGIQQFVTPHFHTQGFEPYQFLRGRAEINIGKLNKEGTEVLWGLPGLVQPGQQVLIAPNEVHSLRNVGESPVDFAFACPPAHLQDHGKTSRGGDRFLVRDFKNPLPSHYLNQQ